MSNTVLVLIFSILLLPGLAGIFIPLLPGIPLMFVIALIYGVIDRFQHLQGNEVMILGGIVVLSLIVDYCSGVIGAKYGGASKKAILFGFIGLIVGIILLPPFGGILGLFLGVLIAEMIQHRDQRRAVKAATGSLLGSLLGIVANLVLGLLFLILFIVFALR